MIHGVDVEADPPVVPDEAAPEENGNGNGNGNQKVWQRVARHVARNPCRYLVGSLVAAVVFSAIGMIAGEFSVDADTGGWESRGTKISDRTAQVLLTELNRDYIFNEGETAWSDLINNVQPGYDDDSDDKDDAKKTSTADGGNRRMTSISTSTPASSTLFQTSSVIGNRARAHVHGHGNRHAMPFAMTSEFRRRLEDNTDLMPGCDFSWYNSESMTNSSRLWPVWKIKNSKSALDADVIHDLCVAEENTQRILEENDHCFGCDEGCLPPMSIVLYARLTLAADNGLSMSCADLRDAWGPYEAKTKEEWTTCVTDFDTDYDPETKTIPATCPDYFSSALVNNNYDETGIVSYVETGLNPVAHVDRVGLQLVH